MPVPSQIDQLIARVADLERRLQVVESKSGKHTIQGGKGIDVSGSGDEITISVRDPQVSTVVDCDASPPTVTTTVAFS
jgi:hypothetical protein